VDRAKIGARESVVSRKCATTNPRPNAFDSLAFSIEAPARNVECARRLLPINWPIKGPIVARVRASQIDRVRPFGCAQELGATNGSREGLAPAAVPSSNSPFPGGTRTCTVNPDQRGAAGIFRCSITSGRSRSKDPGKVRPRSRARIAVSGSPLPATHHPERRSHRTRSFQSVGWSKQRKNSFEV
jgi:hypothetical protein